jgi:anti-sigma regulatory factor (Ser/Thr protein kinase)
MRLDEIGPAGAGASPSPEGTVSRPELVQLRSRCRRQAMQIETLREAVSILTRGARALKAENIDLRAENARLHGLPRSKERLEGAELTEVAIPLDVRAPGAARTVVVQCLADHVPSSVLDNAQLLVSELVTNSVRHSGAPEGDHVVVRVHVWREMCRLEVEDPGRDGVIAPRPPDRAADSGLNLVKMLSQRWGVLRPPDGPTRVWAQLPCRRALA